jgi:DNA-binding winged helix-turn-helix (wHTH) protein
MNKITNITAFECEGYRLDMLKGYFFANGINLCEGHLTPARLEELKTHPPELVMLPAALLLAFPTRQDVDLLMQIVTDRQIKLCSFKSYENDESILLSSFPVDFIIDNLQNLQEIDLLLKRHFIFPNTFFEKRNSHERRSQSDRRHYKTGPFLLSSLDKFITPACFQIDYHNKCLLFKNSKIDLSIKEFKLIELLSKEADRFFSADEILAWLWPKNNRATKSDLYQFMHLLRKKITIESEQPALIENIKGFGYRLKNFKIIDKTQNLSNNAKSTAHAYDSFLQTADYKIEI